MSAKKRIGILLSGRGSNFEALAQAIDRGEIPHAEIALVISNRSSAPGLQRARERGLNAHFVSTLNRSREDYDQEVVDLLRGHRVDLVCLAGYMRLLTPAFVQAFPLCILNIHPSLLPAFPGLDGQRQALDYGVKFSGCTVHFVDETLDGGPVIRQAVVPVLDGDDEHTLADRILEQEHRLYAEAVRFILSGDWHFDGRRVLAGKEQLLGG